MSVERATGTIAATTGDGGKIQLADRGYAYFVWRDCGPDVRPDSVGHDTRVRFSLERRPNGNPRAFNVRRDD